MEHIQGRIYRRSLVLNTTIETAIINLHINISTLVCRIPKDSLTKNFIIQSMEKKKIKQI